MAQPPDWMRLLNLIQGLIQGWGGHGAASGSSGGATGAGLGRAPAGTADDAADSGADGPATTDGDGNGEGGSVRFRSTGLPGLPLFRMAGMQSEAVRQAVMRSGLGTEAALLGGAGGLMLDDLKVALRRLLRHPSAAAAGLDASLAGGVDDLERSQLNSLSAQLQGQMLLSLVIPFGDAGPVALRFFRESGGEDGTPSPVIVDIHSRHSGLGPLWLRTAVSDETRLHLTMWAEREEVAQRARERARDLRWSLTCSGLRLEHLEIHAGVPPEQADPFRGADGGMKPAPAAGGTA